MAAWTRRMAVLHSIINKSYPKSFFTHKYLENLKHIWITSFPKNPPVIFTSSRIVLHIALSSRISILPYQRSFPIIYLSLSSLNISNIDLLKSLLMQHPSLVMQQWSSFLFISETSSPPHFPTTSKPSATWLPPHHSTAPEKFNNLNTRPKWNFPLLIIFTFLATWRSVYHRRPGASSQ